jgi:hypothetical protein
VASTKKELEEEQERNAALRDLVTSLRTKTKEDSMEMAVMQSEVQRLRNDCMKRVVVLTPKICVSAGPGQLNEIGKMDLPMHVLKVLRVSRLRATTHVGSALVVRVLAEIFWSY